MSVQLPGEPASVPPNSAPPRASSTGPRTTAGKAASSQNARKHDLCSRTLRLSPEEWSEYNDMGERYRRDLQPADDLEHTLIDEICFNYWRLQQAREAELEIVAKNPFGLPLIALYIRYRTGYEHGFYKALDKLHQAQRIRKQNAKLAAAPLAAAPLAAAPLAAAPLAAVPLAAVRSAKQSAKPAPSPNAAKAPQQVEQIADDPLRSAEPESAEAAGLADQLEDHILENRVRGELALPPLELPRQLDQQLKTFVSQNPAAVPDRLLELMRKAA
jgi:hypothetical protein